MFQMDKISVLSGKGSGKIGNNNDKKQTILNK